jgi:O-antigen/teichoic acid export membrane protein
MNSYILLAKRIILVAFTNLLLELNAIILLPILTKNLTPTDYGIWVQITVTIGLIPAIALLGMPYSMVRFMASAREKKDIREIFCTIAIVITLAGFLSSAAIFLLAEPIATAVFENNAAVVQIMSLLIFFECLNSITLAYFRTLQKIKKYAGFSFLKICLNIVLVVHFIISGQGIYGAAVGLFISSAIIFLISASVVVREIGISLPQFKNLKEYLSFGMPTVPGNLSSWIVNSSDRYVLGILLGTAFAGYYNPGYTLGNIVNLFIAPLSFMLPPVLSKHYDEREIGAVESILSISMKYFLVLAIPSIFGLSLLSRPILIELTTPEIAAQSYIVTPFVALSSLFFGAYALVAQIIVLEKKTMLTGKIWMVAAALNLGLNFLLIPYLGLLGAAITTLLAFCFAFLITTYYAKRYLDFRFDYTSISKCILASMAMSLFLSWLKPEGPLNLMLAIIAAALVYFGALFLLKELTVQEIDFFRSLLKH